MNSTASGTILSNPIQNDASVVYQRVLRVHFMILIESSYFAPTCIGKIGKDRPFIYPCVGCAHFRHKLLPSNRNYELQSGVPLIS